MRFLPFERTYQLESTPCHRCAGSGVTSTPAPGRPAECWNCRGLGRKVSLQGRHVFDEICALLGATLPARESRIQPKQLDTIAADRIRPDMRVADTQAADRRRTPRSVATVQHMPLEQVRLTFVDGSIVTAAPYALFRRELTPAELAEVDALMAARLDQGAVIASGGASIQKAEGATG